MTCDSDTAFVVALGTGSGTSGQRLMAGAGSVLLYNLYTDPTRSVVWGDGITGDQVSASCSAVDLTVYGRTPGRQNVAAGVDADSITITVSY